MSRAFDGPRDGRGRRTAALAAVGLALAATLTACSSHAGVDNDDHVRRWGQWWQGADPGHRLQ